MTELRPSLSYAMAATNVKRIDTEIDYERVYDAWQQMVIGDACGRLHVPPWEHPVARILEGTHPDRFSRSSLAMAMADLLLYDMRQQVNWLRQDLKRLKGGVRYAVVQGATVVYRVHV